MFKVNDKVIHAREGLSTIVDTTTMMDRDYYVINADGGAGESIYVLVENTNNIIRPIMTREEANDIVKYMKTVSAEFISNTKQRRDQYKKRLMSGSVLDLAYLSSQLYFYDFYNSNGQVVKLGPTDLQMLKDARRILLDELAISFDVSRDQVSDYVGELLQ